MISEWNTGEVMAQQGTLPGMMEESCSPVCVLRRRSVHVKVAGFAPRRTAQQKGIKVIRGRAMVFTRKEVRQEESDILAQLLVEKPEDWTPMEGPVALKVRIAYAYRKGEKKRLTKAGYVLAHDKKPDTDNLLKGLKDVCTRAGIWKDDAQVWHEEMEKTWEQTEGWELWATETGRVVDGQGLDN